MTAESSPTSPDGRLQSDPLLHDHPLAWRIAFALWMLSALLFLALAVPALADVVQSFDDVVYRWAVSAEWGVNAVFLC